MLDRDLAPAPGVQLVAAGVSEHSALPETRNATDAKGRAILSVPQPGTYHLSARKGANAAQTYVATSAEKPGTVTLILAPAAAIEGRVVNTRGEPVPGAGVHIVQKNFMRYLGPRVDCNPDGAFRFEAVPPGFYQLRADAEGYAPAYSELVEPGALGLRLGLTPGGRIVGHVRRADDGTPVEDFAVVAEGLDSGHEQPAVTTDVSGRFAFEHLADDTYRVRGTASTFYLESGAGRVMIRQGRADIGDLELLVLEGTRLTGVVTGERSGLPLSGAYLNVVFLAENWGVSAQTDSNGAYELTGIPPGIVRIGYRYGNGPGRSTEVSIPEGVPEFRVDLVWPESPRISGTVFDATGAPAPGAEVIARAPGAPGRHAAWTVSTLSDGGGKFTMDVEQAADTVEIVAHSEHGRMVEPEFISVPPEGADGVVLRLESGGLAAVSGMAVDGRGRPILARIRFTRLTMDGGLSEKYRESAYSEADGYFALRGLPAGEYAIAAGPMDNPAASGATPFNAGQLALREGEHRTGLRIVLDITSEVSGTVTDNSGAPVYPASVGVFDRDSFSYLRVRTDAFGAYRLRGVPPGPFEIQASANGYETTTIPNAYAGDVVEIVLSAD